MPEILKKIHAEMRKCYNNKSNNNHKNNKSTNPIPFSTLMRLHENKQITIVFIVLNWDGVVAGIVTNGRLFVPCEPTPLPLLDSTLTIKTQHISSVAWQPFADTLAALETLVGGDQDESVKAAAAPAAAVLDDEDHVVGIYIKSGQFIETIRQARDSMSLGSLEIIEQPNPNEVDRALALHSIGSSSSSSSSSSSLTTTTMMMTRSPIEIEHENYSAFRSIIRKKLRDYKFRKVRRLIVQTQTKNGGLDVIVAALRELVGSSVSFYSDDKSDRDIDNGESESLRIPRKNRVNGIDNEVFYYQRLADELVRYDRVRLYMLENTIQFTEIEYRIHDDELLASESNYLMTSSTTITK
jgi:hypothetical protein